MRSGWRPTWSPQMLTSLWRWAWRRPVESPGQTFSYHAGTRLAAWFFTIFSAVESVVVHALLLGIFGSAWWVWAVFGGGVYNTLWILGRYHAALVMRPHVVGDEVLRLRFGYVAEIIVPRSAVLGARTRESGRGGPGKLVVEPRGRDGTRSASFTNGAGTVELLLDPAVRLTYRGGPARWRISRLHVTADDAEAMTRALRSDVAVPRP